MPYNEKGEFVSTGRTLIVLGQRKVTDLGTPWPTPGKSKKQRAFLMVLVVLIILLLILKLLVPQVFK